jgi:hypothetical protein
MKIEFSGKFYISLILLLSALITWPLFLQGYFFHHDDLQVMRIFEMRQCFADFQIPCRWVPDMGYGNGFPLFNYYSALPYYIGGLFSYFLGLVNSAKALFFIPLVLAGVSMYFFAAKLFGRDAGFAAAVLYLFAPYRALDSYVRGAIAESFAIALIPLVFYLFLKITEKAERKAVLGGSLSLAAFLLSHNIMTMLFMPFVALWILLLLYFKKWKNWKSVAVSFALGVGLSAFFLIPVFLEKDLVRTETLTQGGSNFRTHFVAVGQLFLDRTWGYGGSEFGPNDTISFQIGWPLWWLAALSIPVLFLTFKKNIEKTAMLVLFSVMFVVSVFMMHNKSAFIWEMVGTLQYTQFPWRFLSLSIFSAAIMAGFLFDYFKGRARQIIIWIVVISTVTLNWNYFIPRDFYSWINDKTKLEDPLWEIQQKAGILDYLPKTAYEPFGRAPDHPEIIKGEVSVSGYNVRSNKFFFNAKSTTDSSIEVPVFDFPNWKVYVNGKEYPHGHDYNLGRISIELPPGEYQVKGVFKDTLIRTVANLITLISAFLLFLIFNKRVSRKFINGS